MKTKWIDDGWYSDCHDHHVLRCPFCEAHIVKRLGTEPMFCPSCHNDMREDGKQKMSKPRLLTIDELLALPHRSVVWEERKDGNMVGRYVHPMICTREHKLMDEDGEILIHEKMLEPEFIPSAGGGKWMIRRFWDKKPSMERRREVECK